MKKIIYDELDLSHNIICKKYFYSYLEEIIEILNSRKLIIGKNKIDNIGFYLNNNGGELTFGIDYISSYKVFPFEFSKNIYKDELEFMIEFSYWLEDCITMIDKSKTAFNELYNLFIKEK